MDRTVAELILASLCERAGSANENVVLTSAELAALRSLYGSNASEDQKPGILAGNSVAAKGTAAAPFEPTISWHPVSIQPETLVCMDFGTSFSKASAALGDDPDKVPELIDISFGEDTGGRKRFLLPSELFIDAGQIFFGFAAREGFERAEADQDRLIDNPKQYMTLGMDVTELRQKSLKTEQDPERCFSQRDVLVLYLAHFSSLVKRSLSESGVLDEAMLRYAHPGWEKSSEQANGKEMKRIMAEAIALARLYPSDFLVSLELDRAKKLLAAARIASDSDLPFDLLKESVREATAAGAGALLATQLGKRQAFVIVDIGAGTTDIAGCVCVHNAQHGYVRVWEVEPAAKAIPSAGNVIDNALQKMILDASSLTSKTIEFERSQHALRRIIRPLKEALFTRGEVTAELPTGEAIPIKLADFLDTPPMVRLFDKIKGAVAEAAFLVADSDNVVYLVPTGGGARLPFLTDLAGGTVQKDGRSLQLKLRDAMPEALKEPYPDLVPVYPQLAVAVGGAVPFLPEQRQSIGVVTADPGKKTLGPVYRS